MAPPEQVVAFAKEMTDAKVDWQLHAFGGTKHAFMNENANNPQLGLLYSAKAAARAWNILELFLADSFAGELRSSITAAIVPGANPSNLLFTKMKVGSARCFARIQQIVQGLSYLRIWFPQFAIRCKLADRFLVGSALAKECSRYCEGRRETAGQ